jgi:hypothetical protein
MTYNNYNQPEEDTRSADLSAASILQSDIEALISALNHAAASNQAAHQPTIKALEQLMIIQAAQEKALRISDDKKQQQTTEQKQKIDQLSKEIVKLKQQISLQNDRLASLTHWRTIATLTILSCVTTAGCLAVLQKFLPPQLDSATLDKIDFLHLQEAKRMLEAKKMLKNKN